MSWLKQRIHPLQLRYLAAACALCLAVGGGAVAYWLLIGSTEPTGTGQVARLESESSATSAAGESLKPSQETSPAETADPRPAGESLPATPVRPASRLAKEAIQSAAAVPEPAPATETVTVEATGEVTTPPETPSVTIEVPGEASVPGSETATITHGDPNQPPAPAAAPPPPPPPPAPLGPGAATSLTRGVIGAAPMGGVSASRSVKARAELSNRVAGLSSSLSMAADKLRKLEERGAQPGDRFASVDPNRLKVVAEEPVSTFSIDVDTASYSFLRASLQQGVLPPKEAVRIEELINYFPYDYPAPSGRDTPFATRVTVLPAPWNPSTRLMHIGIRGYELTGPRPRANLVFLIDTSGSMGQPNKLPLLVNSLRLLLGSLAPEDRVAVVTYAGSSATALDPTPVSKQEKILGVLGSTESRRLHRRRLGNSARLPTGQAALHGRWRQPGDPGHRRRFQRGNHRCRPAPGLCRARAEKRRVPFGPGLRAWET